MASKTPGARRETRPLLPGSTTALVGVTASEKKGPTKCPSTYHRQYNKESYWAQINSGGIAILDKKEKNTSSRLTAGLLSIEHINKWQKKVLLKKVL